MKIRRFFGKDMRDALNQVKEELGQDAVIMSNRKVADGVELVAAYDKEPTPKIKPAVKTEENKPVPTLSEIIGDDVPDNLKALLDRQSEVASQNEGNQDTRKATKGPKPVETRVETDAVPIGQQHDVSLTSIKDELATLRQVLQFQVSNLFEAKSQRQKPLQNFIASQLEGMGLRYDIAEQLANFIPSDSTEQHAWNYVLQLCANRLTNGGHDLLSSEGVVAFLGPTGTGKTTTIAKLAARYAKKHGTDSVALVNIDTFRIGAFEQLQTYGNIIGCPVKQAHSAIALTDVLFQLRHKKMIFIDTAGFSQRDSRLVSQLEQLDEAAVVIQRYLVLQANTQYSAIKSALNDYDTNNLDGCVFTKLDECTSLGEAISVALEEQLPLSFVTNGQRVPEDIAPADVKSLVSKASKLYKKFGLDHTYSHKIEAKRAQ